MINVGMMYFVYHLCLLNDLHSSSQLPVLYVSNTLDVRES